MVQKNRKCFSQASTSGGGKVPRLCCRKEVEEDAAAGFANTTDWRLRDYRTTGFQYKADDLVDVPEDVPAADNAFARAARSEAAAWPEKEVERAESIHRGLVGKDCYAAPGSKMATTVRDEPDLQVGNGRR